MHAPCFSSPVVKFDNNNSLFIYSAISIAFQWHFTMTEINMKSRLVGGRSVGYLQSAAEELNSGRSRTNPVSGRVEDLDPGPPGYKSSTLTTRPLRLLNYSLLLFCFVFLRKLSNGISC